MKRPGLSILSMLLTSSCIWISLISSTVLGLIYQAYPGQDAVAVLIASVPTLVLMGVSLICPFLFRVVSRKSMIIVSLIIALVAGLLIVWLDMSLTGVILLSAALGIPGGIIQSATPTVLAATAPPKMKDKLLGWHTGFNLLGIAVFQFLSGQFAVTGRFQDGYKAILLVIPILIFVILFYPDIDKHKELIVNLGAEVPADAGATKTAAAGKFPKIAIAILLIHVSGAAFWNTWTLNVSDYVINDAKLGDAVLAGSIASLSSIAGMVAGFSMPLWFKLCKKISVPLSFLLMGATLLLVPILSSTFGAYLGGILNQFFVMLTLSGLCTYLGFVTSGKHAVTAMSIMSFVEGSGVFLCSTIVPALGKIFGGNASGNMLISGIILMVVGVVSFFVAIPAHKKSFG